MELSGKSVHLVNVFYGYLYTKHTYLLLTTHLLTPHNFPPYSYKK